MRTRQSYVTEFLIVTAICYGVFLWSSLGAAFGFDDGEATRTVVVNASELVTAIQVQIICAALTIVILWWRGWRWGDIPLRVTWGGTGYGILLFAATLMGFLLLAPLLEAAFKTPHTPELVNIAKGLPLGLIAVLALVSAVYEELFLLGYLQAVFAKIFPGNYAATAVAAGVAIRLGCHLYQGPIGSWSVVALGAAWGALYMKRPVLWPFIVAHTALNFLPLAAWTY